MFAKTKMLVFRCPFCTADLSRKIDISVIAATIDFQCRKQDGGCDGVFLIRYENGRDLVTIPPQKFLGLVVADIDDQGDIVIAR